MQVVIGVIAAAVVLWLLLRWLATAPPALVIQRLRFIGGLLALAGGLGFAIARWWVLALPLGALGVFLVRGGIGTIQTPPQAGPGRSSVRSAALEMDLEHASGDMEGRVVAGAFAGRPLGDLTDAELKELWGELAADGDSRALLEAYLDRRAPGWREDFEGDAAAGSRPAADAGTMGENEAYEILGLAPGATETEIRAAHRRLMKRVHPDQGGSGFLAARINQAKDRLLGNHR